MLWLVLLLVIVVLVFGPTMWVKWVMHAHSEPVEGMPGTGGELAQHLVEKYKLEEVTVELTEAGDHYDPSAKAVRLSEEHLNGKSLTAISIAAHEVGHAIQHHRKDRRLAARTKLVPVANKLARISTGMIWAAPIVGLIARHPVPMSFLVLVGLSGLVARMGVHVVTLPTEWDASFGKALPALVEGQYIAPGEERIVARILKAAALTYAAAALADILNLARWAAILLRR